MLHIKIHMYTVYIYAYTHTVRHIGYIYTCKTCTFIDTTKEKTNHMQRRTGKFSVCF